MKPMETLYDVIDEAKVRLTWWAICIFGIAYFLSHTSKSMWLNVPIAFLILFALRLLSHEVELRWKVRPICRPTYLSHLQKKQFPLDDPRISPLPIAPKWKRKIDSPLVEAAVDDFISKILKDFVYDMWYSAITPDKEGPEQMHLLISDVIGEISGRIKQINLVDLLTRDVVDLVGNHLDLFRRNQSSIGVDVMGTLSSEERDDRLKHQLIASRELHPALLSSECEYKVLQRLVEGMLAVVLRPREARCPLVRCIGREFLTCLVMQPIMNFASPGFVNELIEFIYLASDDNKGSEGSNARSNDVSSQFHDHTSEPYAKETLASSHHPSDISTNKYGTHRDKLSTASECDQVHLVQTDSVQTRPADWARGLDAAQQRRTQVLAPENLENLWTKGRNYKKKTDNLTKSGTPSGSVTKFSTVSDSGSQLGNKGNEKTANVLGSFTGVNEKCSLLSMQGSSNAQDCGGKHMRTQLSLNFNKELSYEGVSLADEDGKAALKKSNSASSLKPQPDSFKTTLGEVREAASFKESHNPSVGKEETSTTSAPSLVFGSEGSLNLPKLKCRVVGAYFEKSGSKSFAVYSIAVRDAENNTWFVKRRYRNFERLHRHLKDIPNYTLHLPPKRFLSSSIDDSFVHQRCILLDKYLQDLLSIANVAEQHEVWDFLSVSSKNYAFGKSTSVMKTLAVNVDDAMDDIVRQFKGVSDGLLRKVSGSYVVPQQSSPQLSERHMALNWHEESGKLGPSDSNMERGHSSSDNEGSIKDGGLDSGSSSLINGSHSDNELISKGFPQLIKHLEESSGGKSTPPETKSEELSLDGGILANSLETSGPPEDPVGVPLEWTPPNLSVPLLNLVDKIFQLNRRGWLRRQVFWISKQILQLMMEDAIDDWLLRQINWLRRDEIIAQGIRWVQNVLWPNGIFFLKLEDAREAVDPDQLNLKLTPTSSKQGGDKVPRPGSFESQLEAARRASDVKKMLLGGVPTTLVSLIGHKQYCRCAKDIYYFLQSTVCLKQLAYCLLELVLVSLFPELRDLIRDIHFKSHYQLS